MLQVEQGFHPITNLFFLWFCVSLLAQNIFNKYIKVLIHMEEFPVVDVECWGIPCMLGQRLMSEIVCFIHLFLKHNTTSNARSETAVFISLSQASV